MLFAAGCETSISRRIAWPSFVNTIPPIGSNSILSIALGPKHDRIISATLFGVSYHGFCVYAKLEVAVDATYVLAAVIFDI
jgi:hypothetical protein